MLHIFSSCTPSCHPIRAQARTRGGFANKQRFAQQVRDCRCQPCCFWKQQAWQREQFAGSSSHMDAATYDYRDTPWDTNTPHHMYIYTCANTLVHVTVFPPERQVRLTCLFIYLVFESYVGSGTRFRRRSRWFHVSLQSCWNGSDGIVRSNWSMPGSRS